MYYQAQNSFFFNSKGKLFRGDSVTQQLALLPHCKKVVSSIPALVLFCVDLDCPCGGVLSWFSGFLPRSKVSVKSLCCPAMNWWFAQGVTPSVSEDVGIGPSKPPSTLPVTPSAAEKVQKSN